MEAVSIVCVGLFLDGMCMSMLVSGIKLLQKIMFRYLDMLPTTFGNPLWFTDDDLLELKGTTVYRATELQVSALKIVILFTNLSVSHSHSLNLEFL